MSSAKFLGVSYAFLLTTLVIAVVVSNLDVLVNFISAVFGSFQVYLYPAAAWVSMHVLRRYRHIRVLDDDSNTHNQKDSSTCRTAGHLMIGVFLMCFGIFITVFSLVQLFSG